MTTTRFLVPAMDCATEKELIANRLGRLGEVESLDFDLLDRVVTVRHKAGADGRVEEALRDIGMSPKRLVAPVEHRGRQGAAPEGIKLAMPTGDNPTTARAVGDKVGIDEVDADLLPEDKLATIDRLVKERGAVGMIARHLRVALGDGGRRCEEEATVLGVPTLVPA